MAESALYEGWVMHRRVRPRHHRFKYRVFAMLLDLDELPGLDKRLSLFSWNRRGLFSFHDRDHGDGRGLKLWLDEMLARADLSADGSRQVLCYPRILGYVFNPLSVWFCRDAAGALKAVVYEVHNTYDERHAYVLPVEDEKLVRHGCAKDFYVSPFLTPDCRYNFRIRPPGEDVSIAINEDEAGQPILNASFAGERRPLTDRTLLRLLFAYPLMTVKVVLAIHFEAVRLMRKGIRRHSHTPRPLWRQRNSHPGG
jgi:DUF1365 family protein